jgi:hypothetical protein
MRLSEKRRTAIYKAVSDHITDARLKLVKGANKKITAYAGGTIPADTVDAEMFYLERRIFAAVLVAIGAKEGAGE